MLKGHTLQAFLIDVNEPCHTAPLMEGPSLITCSHTGVTPVWCTSRWSMLRNKRMMHFGRLRRRLISVTSCSVRDCACAHADAATVVGSDVGLSVILTILVAPTRLLSSPHHLLAGGVGWGCGVLRFGSRSALYVLSCYSFEFSIWVIELTWLFFWNGAI